MSFEPFKFIFNKPKTVEAPVVPLTASASAPAPGAQAQNSRAQRIRAKLIELSDTSLYLQQAILNRTRTLGVSIDPNVDPDTGRALEQIYGVSEPPAQVTMPMFNALLDADFGIMQVDMAAGLDSALQGNTFQAAALAQVTHTVEKHLVNDGSYQSALPLLLRSLKGDDIVFQQWSNNLGQYPILSSTSNPINEFRPGRIRAREIDLSVGIYNTMDDYTDRFGAAYAGMYKLLAEVNHVEADIVNVANHYFYQPLENIVRIVGMLNALRGLIHKPRLQDIADDLNNYAFVRLSSEVSNSLFSLDHLVQMAISPIKGTLGSLGRIIGVVQGVGSTLGHLTSGGLKGLLTNNACSGHSGHRSSGKGFDIPGLASVSSGVRSLAEHLDWASRESSRHAAVIEKQFMRLADRRLSVHADQLDIMCSLGALDSLIGLAKGFVSETQSGNTPSAIVPQQQTEVLNRILSNVNTGSATTFVSQGEGEIIATPADMPEPSDSVKGLLRRNQIEAFAA